MRFHAKLALLLSLVSLVVISAGLAQEKEKQGRSNVAFGVTRDVSDPQHETTVRRFLTPDEGLALLSAALDSRHHAGSDCSHFVHGLYARAGFPYEYASSSDLYAGIDEFRRVTSPQPGDLAVWRGHAGIVINPAQHSFFSFLRSGPGVDSYDSPYWKQRGRPRFFRYVKLAPTRVLSGSIRTASLQPMALNSPEPNAQVADDATSETLGEPSSEIRSSAKPAENQPMNPTLPRVLLVNSIHPKPDQVGAAFLQSCADSEQNFRGRDLFKSAQPLVVFDHFAVNKVHIGGNLDWVEVQIDELVSLTGGAAEVHKRSERQRWPLRRRDDRTWELTPSPEITYLTQPMAERILAHELAQLTDDGPGNASRTQEKAELARLLDALLQK
jgi:hypothetical protein